MVHEVQTRWESDLKRLTVLFQEFGAVMREIFEEEEPR
jgi:hypothetical protein